MKNPKIAVVVAMDRKRGIGKDNKLPWNIPEDLKHFRALTSGHPIIMGRKTFESIGRPLPNRTNIVITRDSTYKHEGCTIIHSIEEAIEYAKKKDNEVIFIIGGGQIFSRSLALADTLYLTIVDGDFETDTFFPAYPEFTKVVSEKKSKDTVYNYTFIELERM